MAQAHVVAHVTKASQAAIALLTQAQASTGHLGSLGPRTGIEGSMVEPPTHADSRTSSDDSCSQARRIVGGRRRRDGRSTRRGEGACLVELPSPKAGLQHDDVRRPLLGCVICFAIVANTPPGLPGLSALNDPWPCLRGPTISCARQGAARWAMPLAIARSTRRHLSRLSRV